MSPFGTRFVFRRPPSPRRNTHRVLNRERLRARILPRAIKNPTARLAVGDKVKDPAVPPRLTRHRCRVHSSTANTVRLLTRALRPRLLVTFRLGPPGPILSGSVSCFYAITAFSPCQRILTRFFKFSARSNPTRAERAPVRTHAHAHAVSLLFRAARQIFSVRFTQMPSAPAQAPFPRTSARAVRKRRAFNERESGRCRKHMRKTAGGTVRSCALGKELSDRIRHVLHRVIIVNFCTCSGYSGHRRMTRREMPAGIRKKTGHKRFTSLAR